MQKTKQLHLNIVTDFFYTTNIIDGLAQAITEINAKMKYKRLSAIAK